jgi:hypothetical protein
MFRRWLCVLLVMAAAPAVAEETRVFSPRADSVSVTIYRDVFALITETRTVDLPAGAVTVQFDGVVDTLIPTSAVVAGLDRRPLERNYRFDSLTPRALVRRSVGQEVMLTRTSRATGKVTQERAVIESANNGVVLRLRGGLEALYCSGLPEHLTFEKVPEGLDSRPNLSVSFAAGNAGTVTLTLSYLATGFGWQSDYVARLNPNGDRADIKGWATLHNATSSSLRDAQVQVVAGNLNVLDVDDGGSSPVGASAGADEEGYRREVRDEVLQEMRDDLESDYTKLSLLTGCFPTAPKTAFRTKVERIDSINAEDIGRSSDLDEVVVTGLRKSILQREALADYHLYRLPWRTDLNALQTKQAVFLHKRDVHIERFYSYWLAAEPDEADLKYLPLSVVIGFENKKSAGLGEPLPSGTWRFFEGNPSGDIFAGEAELRDQPVGAPFELKIGESIDLSMYASFDDDVGLLTDTERDDEDAQMDLRVSNGKPYPVVVEVLLERDDQYGKFRFLRNSRPVSTKHGNYRWRFTVPAAGDAALSYRVRPVETEDD